MKEYYITWEIELSARSPQEAAEQALQMLQDVNSTATVFKVAEVCGVVVEPSVLIDLLGGNSSEKDNERRS